jgi:hypothetical protein
MLAQVEEAATPQRQDLRRGKGVRVDEKGRAYSVYGAERDASGNVKTQMQNGQEREVYSKESRDSLLTAKAGSVGMGKGEYFDETGGAYQFWANETGPDGNLTVEAQELRKTLVTQAGIYASSDPGAKAKVDRLMEKVGIDKGEQDRIARSVDQDAMGAQAGAPPQTPPAGTQQTPLGGGGVVT